MQKKRSKQPLARDPAIQRELVQRKWARYYAKNPQEAMAANLRRDCIEEDCDDVVVGRGRCRRHYRAELARIRAKHGKDAIPPRRRRRTASIRRLLSGEHLSNAV